MLLSGDLSWMRSCDRELPRELYARMLTEGLRPRAVVDYTREPFVYAPGNVRVTLDYDLRRGLSCADFLDPGCEFLDESGKAITAQDITVGSKVKMTVSSGLDGNTEGNTTVEIKKVEVLKMA